MSPNKTSTMKVWAILFSTSLVVKGLFVIQNEDVELEYNITLYNHCQRDTHRIQLYYRVTISDCVTECGLRSHCKAMNYHARMGLCELFTEAETEFTNDGCIHIRNNDIQVKKSPCGMVCGTGLTCDIQTLTCFIKECMHSPALGNGLVLGNRKEVGMKVMAKCHLNFKPKNGIKQSICNGDGQWYPNIECIRDCGVLSTPPGARVVEKNGTLEGSKTMFACKSDFVHVDGTLTRVCQTDGSWNGTEPMCHKKSCISPGECYVDYPNKFLPGHGIKKASTNSFEKCAKICARDAPKHRSLEFWFLPTGLQNCFCKSVTFQDGYTLVDIAKNCTFYYKL